MVRFLPFLISLALSVYALFSCIQTADEDVPHLPKLVWIILIVFVPFVGPIVWLLMLRTQLGRRDRPVRPPKPSTRPVAPDDDPDFLKSLDRYRDPRTTVKPPEPPKEPRPESKQPKPKQPESKQPEPKQPEPKQPKPKQPEPKQPEQDESSSSESDDGKA